MNKIGFSILITTLVLILYTASPFFTTSFAVITLLLLVLSIMTIWMVIVILKNGTPSKHTFEDRFYEDYDPG